MLRQFIPGAYKILNGQNILTGRSGRTSVKNIHTLSRSFQIVVQSSQELDSREENVVDTLYNGLLSSNRACLARSITLTESTHPRKRLQARSLLKKALQHCKKCQQNDNSFSFRIGLSGPPGAGKSTFLENMGKFLTSQGEKIAVLAVDPSSTTNGGSLMGDKTRMQELSRDLNAFIRPSPTSGHLGGVTRSTNEAIIMCETAGYKTVFIETVGVGQSEYAVADMVDMFVVLIPPAGGDELQGLKRGIMEHSHLVVVNKADGDLMEAAMRMQYEYTSSLKFMRPISPNWRPKVLKVSSLTKEGLPELWAVMQEFHQTMLRTGELLETRRKQQRVWMWNYITQHIMQVFREDPRVKRDIHEMEKNVEQGCMTAGEAAEILLHHFVPDKMF
ncbi:methylmalonic aciduria type A homolog, mitochondrial-like [Daphnia pulicaria]|uniref:methylmalonic aciduria type A homolog, mitochondrial-like n=1 Tax=Daphnia pulicaria TaxID=35523 RepID=UPI001EEA1B8B|nr:methylmalonic aciduria type A homolog, mitochondrial-like [Daphnia pulicaria]